MTGREVFKIWAPVGAKWVDWVRPVPFIAIDNDNIKTYNPREFEVSNINYISKLNDNIAIIVDLPGYDSIKEGIGLSQLGFRPIPIYNGTNEQDGAMPTVDNHVIEPALIWGASKLEEIQLKNELMELIKELQKKIKKYEYDLISIENAKDLAIQYNQLPINREENQEIISKKTKYEIDYMIIVFLSNYIHWSQLTLHCLISFLDNYHLYKTIDDYILI